MRFLCLAMLFCHSLLFAQEAPQEKDTLLNGWYPWDPYQYAVGGEGIGESLMGLDIELVKAITAEAQKKVVYQPVSWKQHQLDLKSGKRDFAAGATYTKEREAYVHFSKPYRFEENSLFLRRGKEDDLVFKDVDGFLKEIEEKKFKLGVIDGYIYADPKLNQWIEDPKNADLLVKEGDDVKNMNNLLLGKIDGFLADRIVGATIIWRHNHGSEINERRLGIKTPIHLMFSKKTISLAQVEKFNDAIDRLQKGEAYRKIISWYLHPVLLLQTIDTTWFLLIEIIGTVAFAFSGLVIAHRDRATLFGAFIFALLPALGGGMIRDVIFSRKPIGAMQSPLFLSIVIGTVLIGFFGLRLYQWYRAHFEKHPLSFFSDKKFAQHFLVVCDGLGLSAFVVSGIVVSVLAKVSPLWLWGSFFAFLTGAGGGILRDLLSKSRDIVSLRGDIYPEIAIFWGFLLAQFLIYQSQNIDPDPIQYAVIATVLGSFLTRLAVYYWDVKNIQFSLKGPE